MRSSLLVLSLILSSGCVILTEAKKLRFGMASGGSSFFEPIESGWNAKCEELGLDCQYQAENWTWFYEQNGGKSHDNYTRFKEENLKPCVLQMKQFIKEKVDGMAVKCNVDHPVFQEARDAGIPVIGFAGDHPGPIDAYVGTDNRYLGRIMARLLKQLKPQGGTYVSAHSGDSSAERHEGFVEEIENSNNRPDRGHWYPQELNFNHTGHLGVGEDIIIKMDLIASHNPTAFLFMYQTPIRQPNYTDFIDRNRWRNITYLGTEGNGAELGYMARHYIDGLVGQLTYDMGSFAAEMLHKMATEGKDSVPKVVHTKLINYNLVPEELPFLAIEQSLLGNLKYIGFTCFGIVAACALACIAWSIYYRQGIVVRASQPFFLAMTAGGILLMSSALIPLSFDDEGEKIDETKAIGICMSIPWLAFIGFAVTFSALFAKTWRVNKFFHSKSTHGRIQVSEKDVLAPFVVLLTLNIIVLVCWTVIDPLTYIRQFEDGTDLWNRDIASNGSCQSQHAAAYLAPLAISKWAPTSFALVVTFLTWLHSFQQSIPVCWSRLVGKPLKLEISNRNSPKPNTLVLPSFL
jgi:ABC-type sugar transport system substrate-binding protein